jgi:hypothetical protein
MRYPTIESKRLDCRGFVGGLVDSATVVVYCDAVVDVGDIVVSVAVGCRGTGVDVRTFGVG